MSIITANMLVIHLGAQLNNFNDGKGEGGGGGVRQRFILNTQKKSQL